jgi:hypothetical protein
MSPFASCLDFYEMCYAIYLMTEWHMSGLRTWTSPCLKL